MNLSDRNNEPDSIWQDAKVEPSRVRQNEELASAIRRTIETINAESVDRPRGPSAERECLMRLAKYHDHQPITSIDVATDVVKTLAICQFPQPEFGPVIDRWSREIAELLLADPVGRSQLIEVWTSVQERTG